MESNHPSEGCSALPVLKDQDARVTPLPESVRLSQQTTSGLGALGRALLRP